MSEEKTGRSLQDILDNMKDNKSKPEADEAYLALLVMDGLVNHLLQDVAELSQVCALIGIPSAKDIVLTTAGVLRSAMLASPKDYLGDYLPGNEEFDRKRKEFLEATEALKAKVKDLVGKIEEASASEEAQRLKDEDKLN